MSRKARSRALLRNLRKQARRGNLSALERKQLLQQEKRFRKGRSGFRKGLGAGLGAGLGIAAARYLTSPAFKTLLESRPTFDELMARMKKEGVPEDKVEDVANTVKDAGENATASEIVQKVEEKVDPAADAPVSDAAEDLALQLEDRAEILDRKGIGVAGDEELIRDIEPIEEEEESIDDDLAGSMMAPSIFDDPNSLRSDAETGELLGARPEATRFDDPVAMGAARAVSPMREMSVISPRDNSQVLATGINRELLPPTRLAPTLDRGQLLQLSEEERAALGPNRLTADEFEEEVRKMEANREQRRDMRENTELTQRLRREGGYDPRTGEYVTSERQQRIDDAFDREFERSAFTDAERAAERENARLDAMDEAAALDAALGRLPVPNEGDLEFGEMEELGQRPALTTPNNALSRRVNVNDPGLRLPIVDVQEDPENFFDPQEEAELLRFRNRNRALPGGFGDVQDRLSDFGEPLLVPGRPSQVLDNRAPRGLALSSEQLLADQARRARRSRRRGSRSGIPYRQEMGGKNPKMADLMKKVKAKYGIR